MGKYEYTFGYRNRYGYVILKIDVKKSAISGYYTLWGGLIDAYFDYCVHYCSLPNASDYTFDSLEEAVAFAAKKIDPCPAEGEFYGYKKALLIKEPEQNVIVEFEDALESSSYVINYDIAGRCIVTLLISAKTARTGCYYEKKCRARSAKVVKIEKINADGTLSEVGNEYFAKSLFCETYRDYVLGKTTYADSFDDSKKIACSNGIHFFLKKEEALAYIGG